MTQQQPASPSVVKRIALRLDTGARVVTNAKWGLTGERQAKLVTYKEGFAKGIVTNADVERMKSIFSTLDTTVMMNRKRKSEQLQPSLNMQVASLPVSTPKEAPKRPKTKQVVQDNTPWLNKCNEIINRIKAHKGAIWFIKPVPLNDVKDYHKVVVQDHGSYLMDLGTLAKNLKAGQYQSPQEFAIDMDTIWHNCNLYNGPDSEVGRLGLFYKEMWHRSWEKAGFAPREGSAGGNPTRSRRLTAGQAPSKWEPQLMEPSDSKRSRGARQRSSQPRLSGQHESTKKGVGEVVSSGRDHRGPMDGERLKLLGAVLEDMDEHAMEGIIDIIRSTGQYDGGEEDEIELDLDNLTPEALWKLDDYAKQVTGGRYNPDAAQQSGPVHRGPVVEGDSDEETDDE